MNTEDFRRNLQSHHDPSNMEYSSAVFISEQLDLLGIEHCPIANMGIIARIEGRRGNTKRCVVLRADIDTLPMQELADADLTLQSEVVMHSSDRDCHAAVLYGVLKQLQANRDFEGTVFGLFQPTEVCGVAGARSVLAEDPFKDYNVAAVIGQQIDPNMDVGELGFCPDKFMASADEITFVAKGTGACATSRAHIKNPIVAMSDLVMRLNMFNSEVCSLSVCKIFADMAPLQGAGECSSKAVMRTFDEKLRGRIKDMIAHAKEEVEYKYDVEVEMDVQAGCPGVENDTQLTYEAMLLADSLGYSVRDLDRVDGTEDFGYYSQLYPSLYYRLGVGRVSDRKHTAMPDERALGVGEEFMYQLALSILNK